MASNATKETTSEETKGAGTENPGEESPLVGDAADKSPASVGAHSPLSK